jgi:hypothetical protein
MNKYNATSNFLCMNARIERAVNYENLGAKIMKHRALDRKIWALEALRGKCYFQ